MQQLTDKDVYENKRLPFSNAIMIFMTKDNFMFSYKKKIMKISNGNIKFDLTSSHTNNRFTKRNCHLIRNRTTHRRRWHFVKEISAQFTLVRNKNVSSSDEHFIFTSVKSEQKKKHSTLTSNCNHIVIYVCMDGYCVYRVYRLYMHHINVYNHSESGRGEIM